MRICQEHASAKVLNTTTACRCMRRLVEESANVLGHQTLRGYKSVFHSDYWSLIWIVPYYPTAKERTTEGWEPSGSCCPHSFYEYELSGIHSVRNWRIWKRLQHLFSETNGLPTQLNSCLLLVIVLWLLPGQLKLYLDKAKDADHVFLTGGALCCQLYSTRSLGGAWKLPPWVQLAWCHLELGIPCHTWGLQVYQQSSRASRRSHHCPERDNLMECVLIRPSWMDSRKTNADTIEDIYLLSHIEDLLAAPA
jgi:hypothetical protein